MRNNNTHLNPQDYPDEFESVSRWDSSEDECDMCGDRSFKLLCRTASANVCADCAGTILKTMAYKAEIAAWHYSRIHNALAANGALRWRLTVLWRYKEAESLFIKQPSSDISQLRKLLVANLGIGTQHPMDNVVRQAAYEACVSAGKEILPFLLSHQNVTKPWKFYANIVLSAGKIAPDHPQVRNLLEKASLHANPNVRGRVAAAIMTHNSPWVEKLLKRLNDDPNPRVREFIVAENKQMPLFIEKVSYPKKTMPQSFQSKECQRNKLLESAQGAEIVKAVDDCYTKTVLKTIYNTYLHQFYKPDDFDVKGGFTLNKLIKTKLVRAFAYILTDKETLAELISQMPSGVKTVLDTLVWEGGEHLAQNFIINKHNLNPPIITYKKETRFGSHIKKVSSLGQAYRIFPFRSDYQYSGGGIYYDYYLYLPDMLRTIFKTRLSPPPEYHLSSAKTTGKTDFVHEDRDRILSRIKLFCAYIAQGNLKYSKNGEKILKTSIKQMAKYCDIHEFYDPKDKCLGVLKTSLIIDFLTCYGNVGKPVLKGAGASMAKSESHVFLKRLFTAFFNDTPKFGGYYLNRMLFHLKGVHNIKSGYHGQECRKNEHTVRVSLTAVLRLMIKNAGDSYQWISVSDIIKYCLYRDIDLEIIDRSFASRYLSFDSESDSGFSSRQIYIGPSLYNDAVITPLVKGVLFLSACFGIIDIAYDTPQNDRVRKKKLDYLSVFDGLRYVRPTELGAYVLGITNVYKTATEKQSTADDCVLWPDEERLLIRIKGQDRLKTMILDKLAEKVSANSYKVTFQSFLKECTGEKDIHAKIKLFKEHITSDPPQIWQDFLNAVVNKIDPLSPQPDMHVFRFSALENQELIALMARDDVLKKYILKAEDYHIVVRSANLLKVKKRLGEFGYFITQLR
ncbi:HEAT repeat domain-containing protein [Desulfococcaceae bacterium HSG9]|nr:HEAT repeat domain-containing protein [Desulfococcaceae bacterium HSG9]